MPVTMPPHTRFAAGPADLLQPADVVHLSGLDFLQGIVEGRYPAPPIARVLNYWLTEVRPGFAEFQGQPLFDFYNPIGSVHGGWFGTLLDSCMACAVQTMAKAGQGYTTLEYRVNIIRPLFETSEPVRATGHCLSFGNRTATAEGKIHGVESGKLYAFGTTTCLVMS